MATFRQIANVFSSQTARERLRVAMLLVADDIRNEAAPDPEDEEAVENHARRQKLSKVIFRNSQMWIDMLFPRVMLNATLQGKALQLISGELAAADEAQLDQDLKFVVSSVIGDYVDMAQ